MPDENAHAALGSTLRKRRRGRQQLVVGAVVVVVVLVGVWWIFLRDVPSRCVRITGPIPDLEKLIDVELKLDHGYAGKSHCSQTVARRGVLGGGSPIMTLTVEDAGDFAGQLAQRRGEKFADHLTLSVATGEAHLFVAGELPPEQHVVMFRYSKNLATLRLDHAAFTVEQAKAYAAAAAQRATRE